MTTLYIIRGVSGAGKSTFANILAAALGVNVYEADQFAYDASGNYNFHPSKLGFYHSACQQAVISELGNGWDVIVANTSTTEKELAPYLAIAEELDCKVVSLVVENRHGNASIHDVPEETLVRQEQRLRTSLKLR